MQSVKKIINELSLEEKAILTAGHSEWETNRIKDKVYGIFLSDGSFGLRKQSGPGDHLGISASEPATCFPATATLANSWNQKIVEKVGRALATEAKAQKVDQILGPALNIKKNPRGGRSFEYFSEDPYLAGKMAASLIKGIQYNGTIATPKHFAVNSQETRRMASNSVVDERALREIYTTNFEIAIKEGHPKSLMSSYNKVNGIYANENKHLLDEILRKEFGFKGYVVSDWGGDNNHVAAIKAGSSLEMPGVGNLAAEQIIRAVRSGNLDEKQLDKRVEEYLNVVLNSKRDSNIKIDWLHQHEVAREAACSSIVLMKNKNSILPLNKNYKVALIGDFAKNPRYQGSGSSLVNSKNVESLFSTAKNYPVEIIGYEQGYLRNDKEDEALLNKAISLAKKSDIVILNIGLNEASESEGLDRLNLRIPKNQLILLDALAATKKKIVVVLSAGSVVEMTWAKKVDAVVHEYLGGEAGASAVWQVLTGMYNPSGRLSETYPIEENDLPFNNEFPQKKPNVFYKESIFVGYRYYETAKVNVAYPFGYGLSYTTFFISNLKISNRGVNVTVKNTGKVSGIETVQLYISKKDSELIRPSRELKGFKQVKLAPNETKTVTIPFDDKTFRFFDINTNNWQTENGIYQIMIGKNVEDICCQGNFEINNGINPVVKKFASYDKYKKADLKKITTKDFRELYGRELPNNKLEKNQELSVNNTISDMYYCKSWIGRFIAKWLKKKIVQSLQAGKPNLNFLFNYNMPFRAIAKMTGGLIDEAMVKDILFIINGHFWYGFGRVIKDYFLLQKGEKELLTFGNKKE